MTLGVSPVRGAPADSYRLFMPFEDEEVNLAMCSRMVERIGGHMFFDRTENESILTVSIPEYRHPGPVSNTEII